MNSNQTINKLMKKSKILIKITFKNKLTIIINLNKIPLLFLINRINQIIIIKIFYKYFINNNLLQNKNIFKQKENEINIFKNNNSVF